MYKALRIRFKGHTSSLSLPPQSGRNIGYLGKNSIRITLEGIKGGNAFKHDGNKNLYLDDFIFCKSRFSFSVKTKNILVIILK